MTRGSPWDFDSTPAIESNRKKPDTGMCPRCKHLHAGPGHDGASGELGGVARCWFMRPRRSARLQDKHGKYRRCRCQHWDIGPVPACPCRVCDRKRALGKKPGKPNPEAFAEEKDLRQYDDELRQDGFSFKPFDRSKVRWCYRAGGTCRTQHATLDRSDRRRTWNIAGHLCGGGSDFEYLTFGIPESKVPYCRTCRRVLARGTLWRPRR